MVRIQFLFSVFQKSQKLPKQREKKKTESKLRQINLTIFHIYSNCNHTKFGENKRKKREKN